MSASKTLMAAIAAATIVGTVGYVSAQTTDSTAPAPGATQPMTEPSTTAPPAGSRTAPSSTTDMSTPPMTSENTPAAAGDLEPKADRN